MSKPYEIPVEGKKYFAWRYEEQTKIKHKVLCAYAKIWISKLGYKHNNIFFDCHGGCGAYINNDLKVSYGSTILVNEIAKEINLKRNTKTGFFYCECEKKNYDNFNNVLADLECTKICKYNDNFENIIKNPKITKSYLENPTLFFVDPFGYDFDINDLSCLLQGHGNEIILNFMFDFINRFITDKNTNGCRNKCFGSSDWQKADLLNGAEREGFLVNLFKNKLKEITHAKYVFAYRMCYPDKDQTYYYLIHATNYIDGITFMKNSFASINNGRVEYLGKHNNDFTLFDLKEFKTQDMYDKHLRKYTGQNITFGKLWENIVEDTAYTDKDLNIALYELEKQGKVYIKRNTSTRGTYKEKDIIFFGGNNGND